MDFYKRLEIVCAAIPHGQVATYGQLALLCGKPRNARQVGYALGHVLKGEIPAHRILNRQGQLSGAAAFPSMDLQRLLLEEEGVKVGPELKVDLGQYGWKHTLADAEEFRKIFAAKQI